MAKNIHQELQSLTNKLSEKQDAILEEWENRLKETKGKSTELAALSRKKFQNNMPTFLKRLYDSLQGKEVSLSDIGKGHGAQRWSYGFNLQQTIKEWGTLHKVIVNEINSFHEELSSVALGKVHEALAIHIQEGIEFSISEFAQLQHRETDAQLLDVEEVLEKPKDISRNQNLRGTSHDLKGIMSNLQMGFFLLEDEELGPKAAELIGQMSTSADSLEQLLNDLLELFRLETNREEIDMSEFNAAKVLRELCESMQPLAKTKELDLKYGGAESLPVKNDQQKIQRIARNIISNALKYTKEGHIEVRWEEISDKQWLLEISDTGPGLHATHAKSLTTGDEAPDEVPEEVENHGEGIGLLIVRHLCKLLDGIIEVETEPGAGTTFKIVFPLVFSED